MIKTDRKKGSMVHITSLSSHDSLEGEVISVGDAGLLVLSPHLFPVDTPVVIELISAPEPFVQVQGRIARIILDRAMLVEFVELSSALERRIFNLMTQPSIPLTLTSYYPPIFRSSVQRFCPPLLEPRSCSLVLLDATGRA